MVIAPSLPVAPGTLVHTIVDCDIITATIEYVRTLPDGSRRYALAGWGCGFTEADFYYTWEVVVAAAQANHP